MGRFGEGQSGGNFQEGRSVRRNHMTFSLLYGGTAEPDAVRLIHAVVNQHDRNLTAYLLINMC